MGLFDRFRAPRITPEFAARLEREPEPQPVGSSTLHFDAETDRIRAEIDLDGLRRLYDSLSSGERAFLLQLLPGEVQDDGARELSEAWLRRLDGVQDPFGRMVAARWLDHLAWVHRGYGLADEVSADGRDAYTQHLTTAMRTYADAAEEMPQDGTPLVGLQMAATELPNEQVHEIAARWRAIDPFNYVGTRMLLKRMDGRWGAGPHDWFRVAAEVAANAPAGAAAHALVAEAVFDRWVYLAYFVEASPAEIREQLFAVGQVQQIVQRAYDQRFRAGAELEFPELTALHLNWFMWVAYQCGMWDVAHDALGRLGGQVRQDVWNWRDGVGAIDAFVEARDEIIDRVEFGGKGYR